MYQNGNQPNNVWYWDEKKTTCRLDTREYNVDAYYSIKLKLSIFSHKEESDEMVEKLLSLIATKNHSSILTRGRMSTQDKGIVWLSIYFADGRKEVECPMFLIRKAFSELCIAFPNDIETFLIGKGWFADFKDLAEHLDECIDFFTLNLDLRHLEGNTFQNALFVLVRLKMAMYQIAQVRKYYLL